MDSLSALSFGQDELEPARTSSQERTDLRRIPGQAARLRHHAGRSMITLADAQGTRPGSKPLCVKWLFLGAVVGPGVPAGV